MNSLGKNREQENLDKIKFEGEQGDLDFGYYDWRWRKEQDLDVIDFMKKSNLPDDVMKIHRTHSS